MSMSIGMKKQKKSISDDLFVQGFNDIKGRLRTGYLLSDKVQFSVCLSLP